MVDVGGCLHTCTHVSDVHDKYLPLSLAPYFLGQGLSMKLELTDLTTLPDQCAPGILLSPRPQHQDHRHVHHTQLLCGLLTPSLRSLCSVTRTLQAVLPLHSLLLLSFFSIALPSQFFCWTPYSLGRCQWPQWSSGLDPTLGSHLMVFHS